MTRREPMRKVGADEETFRGGVKSMRRVYPRRKAVPTRKVDEEAET
jgi:ASC-1-like (ASCH) protein